MLKLIRLEWKKHTLWKYVRNACIATIALLGLLMLISSDAGTGKIVAQTGKSEIHSLTEMFLNMAYLVFTGAMLSTFVVSEYENKLIHLMFSYPIKRSKIMVAKILAVCIFNFATLVASKFLVYGILVTTRSAKTLGIYMGDLSFWTGTLLGAIFSICSGCIPLLVGMKMKSSKATLIASFIIMLAVLGVTQGNILPYNSFAGMMCYASQILLAVIAVILATYSIETEDIN